MRKLFRVYDLTADGDDRDGNICGNHASFARVKTLADSDKPIPDTKI